MDIQKRDALYEAIAKINESQDWNRIIELCIEIINLNLPDLEKCVAWVNAGKPYGHLKKLDRALECFDTAIRIEAKHNRFFCLESKASFLAELGHYSESSAIYEELKNRADLYISDYQRIEANLEAIRQKE